MYFQRFASGPIDTNAYLVGDEQSGEAMVVDAPWEVTRQVVAAAQRAGLRIATIVMTHGHWDHIADARTLQQATEAPIAVHAGDAEMLRRPESRLVALPFTIPPVEPARLLEDGDEVEVGGLHWRVIHTPGHTPGGICLYEAGQGILLAGDTLFPGGYGRVDLPEADPRAMAGSLRRLLELPDTTLVYPGHGVETTIGAERALLGVLIPELER